MYYTPLPTIPQHSTNQAITGMKYKNEYIHTLFLDLKGTFDLLCWRQLVAIAKIMIGPDKIVNIPNSYHTDTVAKLKSSSNFFPIQLGIRQEGSLMFCTHFEYLLSVMEHEVTRLESRSVLISKPRSIFEIYALQVQHTVSAACSKSCTQMTSSSSIQIQHD